MKLILLTVMALLQIIDMKKFRGIMSDELLDYDLDKSFPSYSIYFSIDHLILELSDDDKFIIAGYGECIKSMERNIPIRQTVRTQYYQNSKWNEGQIQLNQMDVCKDYTTSWRFWYNITKLWTSDICPPQKGDKWFINNQTMSAIVDVPPLPLVPWRVYIKTTQGMPGFEKHSFGLGVQVEFVEI